MKNFKNIYLLAGALALCSVGFVSCDDDDEYDFPGTDRTLVYAKGSTANYSVLVSPILTSSGVDFSTYATVNKRAAGDIRVTYVIDNSLIDTYNDENGTDYIAVPDELILIENPTLVIPKGEMQSAEAFNIKLNDPPEKLALLDKDSRYLIPVRLDEANGGGSDISTSLNRPSYITIEVSNNVIATGEDTSNAGTEVTDFTGWAATCSTGDDVSAMLDGNKNNYFQISSDSPFDVTVDMGKEYKFGAIKGMLYEIYWGNYGFDNGSFPQGMTISVSTDGTNWLELGENPNGDSWSAATNIVFAGTITARYIKLGIPVVSSYYGTSAEFNCGLFTIFEK